MTNETARAIQANKIVEELAVLCGIRKSEMVSFINCLSVWTSKGYNLEQALAKHMEQIKRFTYATREQRDSLRPLIADWFYPEAA